MVVLQDGLKIAEYPVSTSKFGLGDRPGSDATPLGELKIRKKIGAGAPLGAVFKSRERTGEVIAVDAPGRDPIVTRILCWKASSLETGTPTGVASTSTAPRRSEYRQARQLRVHPHALPRYR